MLREVADHYKQSLGGVLGMMVEEEYFLLLREIDPVKAAIVEKRYAEEKISRRQKRDTKGRFTEKEDMYAKVSDDTDV